MNSNIYILVNSQGICENKFLWDGVTVWNHPNDTLICKETEVGINLEIGDLVKQDLPNIVDEVVDTTIQEQISAIEADITYIDNLQSA